MISDQARQLRSRKEEEVMVKGGPLPLEEPLERTKMKIVDKLQRMTRNMNEYTEEVETKLEKAYKAVGGTKKYGFDKLSAKNAE